MTHHDQPTHQRPRRVLVLGAAVVAVLGIAAGIGAVAANGDEAPAALLGTWRPTFIAGFDNLDARRPHPATVTFGDDGQWRGSDGCNVIGGEYEAGTHTISAEAGEQTAIGCENMPNATALLRAARCEVNGTTLTLSDDNHRPAPRVSCEVPKAV
jgi:heat shock protein HslJ